MEEKGVNRQTGKWQYQDYSERYEKAGEMTFRELADWYFDHYAQHRLKASTVYNYRYSVERFPHPEMVFTTKTGKYMDHTYVERTFKAMIKDTDFPDITLHSLRHAYATFMLAQGVDLKVVSSLLGHSSISTTANLYTDVLDRSRAEAAEKLELELFGR